MNKIPISSTKSIHDLVSSHPGLVEVMVKAGFKDITNPMMLNTAGRYMTLEKGAKMKKMDWDDLVRIFEENGFTIVKEG